ncbi:MAG: hypothetical protein ACUVQ6_01705, partial [Dissulfurimicrobium sp.]|uniref:hypothetical protein n=1 Tax=Dissulfurimicrobium sp. TaxID=2022436 RepID=UPI00404A96A2
IVFQSKGNLLRETVKYISLGRNTYACIIRADQVTCDIRRNKPLYCKDIDGDDPVFVSFSIQRSLIFQEEPQGLKN